MYREYRDLTTSGAVTQCCEYARPPAPAGWINGCSTHPTVLLLCRQIVTWAPAIVLVPTPSRSWRCRWLLPTSAADLPSSSSTWVSRLLLRLSFYRFPVFESVIPSTGFKDQVPPPPPGPAAPAQTSLHHQETKHLLLRWLSLFVFCEEIKLLWQRRHWFISLTAEDKEASERNRKVFQRSYKCGSSPSVWTSDEPGLHI